VPAPEGGVGAALPPFSLSALSGTSGFRSSMLPVPGKPVPFRVAQLLRESREAARALSARLSAAGRPGFPTAEDLARFRPMSTTMPGGDVVGDPGGEANAIAQLKNVELLRLRQLLEAFAALQGEGPVAPYETSWLRALLRSAR